MSDEKSEGTQELDRLHQKKIYLNGVQLAGVSAVSVEYDVQHNFSRIHLTLIPIKGGASIDGDTIDLYTPNK